jgi:hypothetical protein
VDRNQNVDGLVVVWLVSEVFDEVVEGWCARVQEVIEDLVVVGRDLNKDCVFRVVAVVRDVDY